jgi:uncharacterized protein
MKLEISSNFSLPLEAVTQTFGILAKRGVGKTYTAAVMAEAMLIANQPICVVDPIGVWWGLRASADGKGHGYSIVVFGGDHADLPLDAGAGELIADVLIDKRISAVLDLSQLRKGEAVRFMEAFAERLYHRNREALHLFLDEADAWAPQNPLPGTQRLLGAIEDLVRRGRARGVGVTLITQRAAVLNKNVLTQIEVLVCLRTIGPQDRKAIDEWINIHGTAAQRKALMDSLASLPVGTAWFWSPGWLDVFELVQVRKRLTFDSSATPKPGVKVKAPERMAPVDIEALREALGQVAAKAKSDDPKTLKARISALERELANKLQQTAAYSQAEVQKMLNDAHEHGYESARRHLVRTLELFILDQKTIAATTRQGSNLDDTIMPQLPAVRSLALFDRAPEEPNPSPSSGQPTRAAGVKPRAAGVKLMAGERKILTALAQYPGGRTKIQVAILAGYAANGGGFNNYLSSLRSRGWMDGTGDSLRITQSGLESLGSFTPLPQGAELRRYWQGHGTGNKAGRTILDILSRGELTKEALAKAAGYEPTGGGFNNALSRLRTLELIQRSPGGVIRLAPELLG